MISTIFPRPNILPSNRCRRYGGDIAAATSVVDDCETTRVVIKNGEAIIKNCGYLLLILMLFYYCRC